MTSFSFRFSDWKAVNLWLVYAIFFLDPILFAAFLVRLPEIKEQFDLSNSDLAVTLVAIPIGALASLPFVGVFIDKIGVRNGFLYSYPFYAIIPFFISLTDAQSHLFVMFFIIGGAASFLLVGLNLVASYVEQTSEKLIMNKAHGSWSLGLFAGSWLSDWLFGLGMELGTLFLSTGLISMFIALVLLLRVPSTNLVSKEPEPKEDAQPKSKLAMWFSFCTAPLLLLVAYVLPLTIVEGAVADWSAIYLRELLGPEATNTGLGLSLFALFHAAGRFSGDRLKLILGAKKLARITSSIALVGAITVVATTIPYVVIAGFALLGVGISVGFPLTTSATADLPGSQTKTIALISYAVLIGFLVGPPFFGFMADIFSLRISLCVFVILISISVVFSNAVVPSTSNPKPNPTAD